ncbi:hypothetical protein STAL104432_05000 [Streptomyces albus]
MNTVRERSGLSTGAAGWVSVSPRYPAQAPLVNPPRGISWWSESAERCVISDSQVRTGSPAQGKSVPWIFPCGCGTGRSTRSLVRNVRPLTGVHTRSGNVSSVPVQL